MVTDPIADLLTRIRNAAKAKHPTTVVPASRQKEEILRVLRDEGYIDGFESCGTDPAKPEFKVTLRYEENGASVIRELNRLSKPGRRWHVQKTEIPRTHGGLGVVILSTSHGVMTDREARKQGVGGELVCSVF